MIDHKQLRKSMAQANIPTELSEPTAYFSTGNYALNYIISGTFRAAIPNKRQVMLCGPSGSGKSYLACSIAKTMQDAGYFVVYVDTERALDTEYLSKIGMKMDDDNFLALNVSTLEKLSEAMSAIFRDTAEDSKVVVVIDSLGNLDTEDRLAQFEKDGTLKNDMGLLVKKQKQLIRDINVHAGTRDMTVIVANHVYMNQDMMNGKGKYIVNGGEAIQYIPSICLLLDKKELRNEDDKKAQIRGIRMTAKVIKTRFFRHAGKCELEVPYDTGLDPLSGFIEFALAEGLITQAGAWYNFKDPTGKEHKFYARDLAKHIDSLLLAFDKMITEKTTEVEE